MVNNKNLTEIEYYMTKKDRTDWTQAEYDIRDGILRICDVPFEYRSLSLYRKGYRKCFIDCFEISRPREIAKEAAPLEKQILEDIAECEARYQRSGNLSKEYPWYLLKARMYCLKRLYQEGVIDGLFKKRDTASCVADVFSQDKLSNDSLASFPFEYRSRVFYIMAGRFVAGRGKTESDLLKKTILDDAEESAERFWKYGNLSKRYPCPDLLLRKAGMKNIMIDFKFYKFFN